MLSRPVRQALSECLSVAPQQLLAHPLGGGCIASAFRLDTPPARLFLKTVSAARAAVLGSEAAALQVIAVADQLRVPTVIGQGVAGDTGWLLLEYIDLQPLGDAAARLLGARLAALHATTGPGFGWQEDNWIGTSPQPNNWLEDWGAFFGRQRLAVQLELALQAGLGSSRLQVLGERLLRVLPACLADYRPAPSLLHGDLWTGNVAADCDGEPVVYDPASYYGDAETDLAMSRLFGALPAPFYQAYQQACPLADGWEWRSTLYQLYHVLNHLNLFGGAYGAQAERMMNWLLERRPC